VAQVLIIGAGVAGLTAWRELHRAGLGCELLEARERIGGRIFTINGGETVELGAEFVHGKPPEFWKFLQEQRLAVEEVAGLRLSRQGNELRPMEGFGEAIARVNGQIEDGRDERYADFLARADATEAEKAMALNYVEGFNAASARRIGTAAVRGEDAEARETEGDRAFRVKGGYEKVIGALMAGLPPSAVHLETEVRQVTWRRGFVEVEARRLLDGAARSFLADAVVITVPVGVLRAPGYGRGAIRFDPPLPEKQDALERIHMGQAVKVAVRCRERFWERYGAFGFAMDREAAIPVWWTQDTQRGELASGSKARFLIGWAGGPKAGDMRGLTLQDISRRVVESMARVFNIAPTELNELIAAVQFHDWTEDPFSRGAYSYPGVGGLEAAKVLAQPVEGTVFFAGEATDAAWGTVHGAMASGVRVAREILGRL